MSNLLSLGIKFSRELWSPLGSAKLQDQKGRIPSHIHVPPHLVVPRQLQTVCATLAENSSSSPIEQQVKDDGILRVPCFLPVKIKSGHFIQLTQSPSSSGPGSSGKVHYLP